MTFKEFLQMDELDGQFGNVKAHHGPLGIIQAQSKLIKPVRGHGSSVGRMLHTGGSILPSRPAKIASVHGPLTHPTFLK